MGMSSPCECPSWGCQRCGAPRCQGSRQDLLAALTGGAVWPWRPHGGSTGGGRFGMALAAAGVGGGGALGHSFVIGSSVGLGAAAIIGTPPWEWGAAAAPEAILLECRALPHQPGSQRLDAKNLPGGGPFWSAGHCQGGRGGGLGRGGGPCGGGGEGRQDARVWCAGHSQAAEPGRAAPRPGWGPGASWCRVGRRRGPAMGRTDQATRRQRGAWLGPAHSPQHLPARSTGRSNNTRVGNGRGCALRTRMDW